MPTDTIFTIGHSDHTWEEFAALLTQHGIEVLIDTRSNQTSRFAPFASRRTLPTLLGKKGIRYLFRDDALGGKPSDPSMYGETGKPDYERMHSEESFKDGVKELLRFGENSVLAIMCAEEDPSKCHRRLLIEPSLLQENVEVLHISGDGSIDHSGSLGGQNAYRRQLQGKLLFP